MINNQQTTADNFNNYFLSTAENINVNNIYSNINCHTIDNSSMQLKLQTFMTQYLIIKCNPTSPKETDKIIKTLKSKYAYGYDDITTKLLKISSPFISWAFNYTCNKTLSTGIFHDQLKFSEIKPLYKKCNKNNASNYQPISLLTSFSKVFETVMQSSFLKHFNKYNILNMEQHGFRTKSITTKATYTFTNKI